MITIILLSISGVMCATLMKKTRPEIAYCINLILCIMIALYVLNYVKTYIATMHDWEALLKGYEKYIQLLFKMISITYLCEISADLCKDAGYNAIAGQIMILGKCIILMVGIPIIQNLLTMIEQFW